jgi:hypothetical protein
VVGDDAVRASAVVRRLLIGSAWHTDRMGRTPPRRVGGTISALLVVALLGAAGSLLGLRESVAGESVVDLRPSGPPEQQLPAELIACSERVHAGELVLVALGTIADHWETAASGVELTDRDRPTNAELRYSATLTLPLALQDLDRLQQQRERYDGLQGSCGDLLDAAVGSLGGQAEVCITRARAVSDAVAAGTSLEADWRGFTALMESVYEIQPAEYERQWLGRTGEADTSLVPFREAMDVVDDAPVCALSEE